MNRGEAGWTVVAAVAVVLACVPSDTAAAATDCQKLHRRHKDIATSRTLVTVMRGDDQSGRISACVLPRGRVRTLASWRDSSAAASVLDTAGTWVLVEERFADSDDGGVGRSLTRVEVRHNRSKQLAGASCHFSELPCRNGTDFGEAAIAPSGAGAFEQIDLNGPSLQAFGATGVLTKLADGAVGALRVTRTQIRWTQAGARHAVALP
jgi:hypothetical protein